MIESINGGVKLHLFIQPKSSKNEIVGIHDGKLKIKITAPPVDGKANAELVEFLSDILDIPKRQIEITKGDTGRNKTVIITGISQEIIEQKILSKI
jgi:TIGR00251 family protein